MKLAPRYGGDEIDMYVPQFRILARLIMNMIKREAGNSTDLQHYSRNHSTGCKPDIGNKQEEPVNAFMTQYLWHDRHDAGRALACASLDLTASLAFAAPASLSGLQLKTRPARLIKDS